MLFTTLSSLVLLGAVEAQRPVFITTSKTPTTAVAQRPVFQTANVFVKSSSNSKALSSTSSSKPTLTSTSSLARTTSTSITSIKSSSSISSSLSSKSSTSILPTVQTRAVVTTVAPTSTSAKSPTSSSTSTKATPTTSSTFATLTKPTTSSTLSKPTSTSTSHTSSSSLSSTTTTTSAAACSTNLAGYGCLPLTSQAAFVNAMLNQHNTYRARHNAPAMTWAADLVSAALANAQNNANNNVFVHTSNNPNGENIAYQYGYNNPQYLGFLWYDEERQYNFTTGGFSEATGHFTQMAWLSSTELGCAYVQAQNAQLSNNGWFYLSCEYRSPGNYAGQYQQKVLAPNSQAYPTQPPQWI